MHPDNAMEEIFYAYELGYEAGLGMMENLVRGTELCETLDLNQALLIQAIRDITTDGEMWEKGMILINQSQ
jgi:hypothetical protein